MTVSLRAFFKRSRLYAFNTVNRDAWVAEQAKQIPPGSVVIDVGAGSCPYRALFAHCEYRSQDFASLHSDQLRGGAYGRIDYTSDAANIPVPDSSFDAVLCTEVLEHHEEPARLVSELARILKPGGRLLLSAPLGSGIHQEPHHYYGGFTPYWYRTFLPRAGLGDITISANAGSFKFFSQEAVRFLRLSRPFGQVLPPMPSVVWTPIWSLLLPLLGGIVPIACDLLDRFDKERRFTVGYHVTAVKR